MRTIIFAHCLPVGKKKKKTSDRSLCRTSRHRTSDLFFEDIFERRRNYHRHVTSMKQSVPALSVFRVSHVTSSVSSRSSRSARQKFSITSCDQGFVSWTLRFDLNSETANVLTDVIDNRERPSSHSFVSRETLLVIESSYLVDEGRYKIRPSAAQTWVWERVFKNLGRDLRISPRRVCVVHRRLRRRDSPSSTRVSKLDKVYVSVQRNLKGV